MPFVRPVYLSNTFGEHRLRFLVAPVPTFIHYFRGKGSIRCLGSECPICQNNKNIKAVNPDDYRSQPGYNGSQIRYYANVLDRTMVKVCPNTECQVETKPNSDGIYLPQCWKCGTFITEVEPGQSNKVKISNLSDTVATELKYMQNTVKDADGEKIGLENFDVRLVVMKVKDKKVISAKESNNFDKVEVPEDALYDLDKAVITLTPDEIVLFVNGHSLRDIFVARKGETSSEFDKAVEEELKEVSDSVAGLFN